MDTIALKPKLTRLKLSGILDTLGSRLEQAQGEKWSYSQFLDFLLSDEVERRDHKQLVRRLSKSGLDPDKTLTTFDFTFNPKIHEPTIRELATCRFLEKKECLLLLGPSGVGKSHLAQAIGNEAVRRGYEVLYRRTSALLGWIAAGEGDGSRERRLRQTAAVAVLILDDFGMKPLSEAQQSDLYELICERYERAPMIITSNRDFNEWPMIFANPLMGSAAMDRLVHRASKIVIEGKSYRVDAFIQRTRRLSGEQPEEGSDSQP
jgi:DNA replication protein DnaC